MYYRGFFSRPYMTDYTSALSWDNTFTVLWYLYSSRWRDKESLVPWNQTLGDPHPGYSSFELQLERLYLRTGQWKIL